MSQRYLTPYQLSRALDLWDGLKLNTLEIAIQLGFGREGEPVVYRSLAERRERMRARVAS